MRQVVAPVVRVHQWYSQCMSEALGPTSHHYVSQRLRLHYVDWGNPDAPPLLLVHGGRDHCRNWDWVAQALRKDFHIVAPDLRGHGDSQWMLGGTYSPVDFVFDIAQLVHRLELAPLTVMGHSLGGMVSLLYAGAFPDQVRKLVSIEGFGPSPQMMAKRETTPPQERMGDWVNQLRDLSGRSPRRYTSLQDAISRMQAANPHLSGAQARHLTVHGVNQNEDGTWSWKFDNYTRAFPPFPPGKQTLQQLLGRITCPVLMVRGSDSWVSDPAADGRITPFQHARVETISDAGHWVHHDQLDPFLGVTRPFLMG